MNLESLISRLRSAGVLTLAVKVIPRSARNEILGEMADGTLKVKVAAAPEKGRANAELCAFLASQLGVPQANVRVESGAASRRKRIRVLH